MKWISVKEDLPPDEVRVLAYGQLSELAEFVIIDAYFRSDMGWHSYGYDGHILKVFYWHPLSEIPKVNEKETAIKQHFSALSRAASQKRA